MFLSVCGFNHKTANLQDREPFQFQRNELTDIVADYLQFTGVQEAVVVCTCNRVEFYRVIEKKNNHFEELIRFYRHRGIPDPSILRDICYCHQGTTAARHLFRVTSGLDSLVLGEDQVIHQVKEAYSAACAVNGPGKVLHKVFHLAFQISKRIHSQTQVAAGPRNIPGAAIELLNDRIGDAIPMKAIICGVNNLAEILLEHLTRRNIPTILANRTLYPAQKMAVGFGAEAASLENLPELLQQADVVFTVMSAKGYILTPGALEKIDLENRKMFLIDLAVPRNIDPEVAAIKGVILLDLQDLKRFIDVAKARRSEEIPQAEELIEQQVGVYSLWRKSISSQDKLENLRILMNSTREIELEKVKNAFKRGERKALEAFSHTLMREFLRLAPYLLDEDETLKNLISDDQLK